MRITRNFKCTNEECNNIVSRLLDSEVTQIECPECGAVANKTLSAPRVSGNTTGSSPSYSKFKY